MGFKTMMGIRRDSVEVAVEFPEMEVKGRLLLFKF